MINSYKIEDDVKYLRKQIETLKSNGAMFKKRADTLKELLSEEVSSHQITKNILKDACDERDEYRNKFINILSMITDLKPGARITKEFIEQINRFNI